MNMELFLPEVIWKEKGSTLDEDKDLFSSDLDLLTVYACVVLLDGWALLVILRPQLLTEGDRAFAI